MTKVDLGIPARPGVLSEYDFWELEAFWHKTRSEGWGYAVEHYHPRFEFASHWPIPADILRELLDQYRLRFGRLWDDHGDVACDRHNSHVGESDRRMSSLTDRRTPDLWGVQYPTGVVLRCPTEEWAWWVHNGTRSVAGVVQPGSPGLSDDAARFVPEVKEWPSG